MKGKPVVTGKETPPPPTPTVGSGGTALRAVLAFHETQIRGAQTPTTPVRTPPVTRPTPTPSATPPPRRVPPPVPTRERRGDVMPTDNPLDPTAIRVRMGEVGKRLLPLARDAADRVGPLRDENTAIGVLLTDPLQTQAAKDRMDRLEAQVTVLEKRVVQEKKVAVARQQLDDFQAGRGPQRVALMQKATTASGDIDTALASVESNKAKVVREGIIFDSRDKDYHKEVTNKLKEFLPRAKAALADPTTITKELVKETTTLGSALYQTRLEYENMTGVTKKDHIAQRQAKVACINEHMAQLSQLGQQLKELREQVAAPAIGALTAITEIGATDPTMAGQVTRLAQVFKDDPAVRKTVLETAGESVCVGLAATLIALPTPTDTAALEEVTAARGGSTFLHTLATKAVGQEAETSRQKNAASAMNSFFRANTTGTKLAKAAVETSIEGKRYLESNKAFLAEQLEGLTGSVEMDPTKMSAEDQRNSAPLVARAKSANKAMTKTILDNVTADVKNVPVDVAKLADDFYEEALRTSNGNQEFALTQVGGFVMLRLINPLLLDLNSEIDKTLAKTKKDKERKALEDQKRAAVLQGKLLQNLSNNVKFGAKEAFMAPLNEVIETSPGVPSPEMVQMRTFFRDLQKRGRVAKMPIPSLAAIVAKAEALEAFRAFCTRRGALENLEFWEAAKDHPTGPAAQKVYDNFLAPNAATPANIDSSLEEFHECNRQADPKPWDRAPWDRALTEIWKNLESTANSIGQPMYANEANAIKAAML